MEDSWWYNDDVKESTSLMKNFLFLCKKNKKIKIYIENRPKRNDEK